MSSDKPHVIRPVILAGLGAWLGVLVLCIAIDQPRLTTILMPLWRPMFALAGQGPNLGSAERPLYEATPVHALFGLLGIALSAVVYIGLAWAWGVWRQRRASGKAAPHASARL
jgi:hypothetical protein